MSISYVLIMITWMPPHVDLLRTEIEYDTMSECQTAKANWESQWEGSDLGFILECEQRETGD